MAQLGERLLAVSDLDDPRVADFRQVREADLVGRRGQFVAEGEVETATLA